MVMLLSQLIISLTLGPLLSGFAIILLLNFLGHLPN